jgi:hypothetical protein
MAHWSLDETLFAGSTVLLFGRVFDGLSLVKEAKTGTPKGAPPVLVALQDRLKYRDGSGKLEPTLARIYGFSYLGNYHKLPEPTVLLVYGDGDPVPPEYEKADLDQFGVEVKGETFTNKVQVWALDRADYTVRIDITPGWLADVLLEPGLSDGTNMTTRRATDGAGRSAQVGRAAMVGRACMVGRGNCG